MTRRFRKIHVKDTAPGMKRPHFRTSSTVTAIGGAGRAVTGRAALSSGGAVTATSSWRLGGQVTSSPL